MGKECKTYHAWIFISTDQDWELVLGAVHVQVLIDVRRWSALVFAEQEAGGVGLIEGKHLLHAVSRLGDGHGVSVETLRLLVTGSLTELKVI